MRIGKFHRSKIISQAGFTLLELIIFSAIFSLVAITFVAILVSVVRIQAKESATASVNRESQFLLQTIQRYVEESSMVDTEDIGVTTTTLVLRMTSSSLDIDPVNFNPARTFIYATGGVAYIKEKADGVPQPLTSSRVVVDRLEFKKRSQPDSHDSVDVILSISFNTPNPTRKFSQLLQTAVARVSAATFDSNIISATTTDTNRNLGVLSKKWKTVNGIIYFSDAGSSVGINKEPLTNYDLDVSGNINTDSNLVLSGNGKIGVGTSSPAYKIDIVGGGIVLRPAAGKPFSCNSSIEGLIWFTNPGGGVDDKLEVCMYLGGSYRCATLNATSS